MATVDRRSAAGGEPPVDDDPEVVDPSQWLDRSSLDGDYMVMIEGLTAADWWRLAPERRICEYLDGVVYMPSPASDDHQDVTLFWIDLLNGFRYARAPELVVRFGPGVLRLSPERFVEPDAFVLPMPGAAGPPALLVIEVLSKSTRTHDLKRKSAAYRQAGIPEYLYVDLARKRLIPRGPEGGPATAAPVGAGIWRSKSLPGFWIEVGWLWQEPLPDPRACLARILAGPPG